MTSLFGAEGEFSKRVESAIDFHVVAFTEGLKHSLVGLEVVDVKGEVWSAEGHWSIVLTLSDGSIIEAPAMARAAGPLAELVRVAGGNPFGSEEDERDAQRHGWEVG